MLKFIIATVAFGMGIDAPDMVIHWGTPSMLEDYIQESGRCAHDGRLAIACLYFRGFNFNKRLKVDDDVVKYCCISDKCKREVLMHVFDKSGNYGTPSMPHSCCDVCSSKCTCEMCLQWMQ